MMINYDEMKWNEMKWKMKWNEMKWNEMKWNEMKWNEMIDDGWWIPFIQIFHYFIYYPLDKG